MNMTRFTGRFQLRRLCERPHHHLPSTLTPSDSAIRGGGRCSAGVRYIYVS
jgi:hypothetical protein